MMFLGTEKNINDLLELRKNYVKLLDHHLKVVNETKSKIEKIDRVINISQDLFNYKDDICFAEEELIQETLERR